MSETSLIDSARALQALCASIVPPDEEAAHAARQRLDRLTKPRGSLGQLETLLVRLAASSGQPRPRFSHRVILLAAADHGVAAEGVSAYPQAVTAQMVANFLAGGAAINALAAAAEARIVVVDAGVLGTSPSAAGAKVGLCLRRLDLRQGSGNIVREPALTRAEALIALLFGADLVDELARDGLDLLALGEMGIANTTPAAALTSAFTGVMPALSVGRGTGIDDPTLIHKRVVVAGALQRAQVELGKAVPATPASALTILAELGGLEIAVLVGAMLKAAALRVPVVLDGYITTAAALVAATLAPALKSHLFASHCSTESGHVLALNHLGLSEECDAGPLLRLDMRLGEGSGAALALPLIGAACRVLDEMATFAEAGVADG